jgi:predicted ArsR family transcriptional regulator
MNRKKKDPAKSAPPASFDSLDRIFHEPARLAILTALTSRPAGVVFNDLKELCNLTDGNLSRHLQALREAGVVELWKRARTGRPQTWVQWTRDGRARFVEYLDALEDVVRTAIDATRKTSGQTGSLGRGPGLYPA